MSTGFSDQHSSVEFTSQTLVDGARIELAFHGCRPWVIPLYEPPSWGEMRESNSRDWSHNPVPKPFGQSRHKTWSWSSESNTRRRGTSSLHSHCARPANSWSWHAASNCGRALTMRLLFPLSYTSGAGAAIRTPITDLRGPRSSYQSLQLLRKAAESGDSNWGSNWQKTASIVRVTASTRSSHQLRP